MSPEALANTTLSPGSSPFFIAHAREQIRELVILLLRPLLERMIVAARAGEALAQERLRGVLGDIDRILVQHEIIQRAVLARVAG